MDLIWQSAEVTHTGKRRTHNEDAVMSRPDAQLWAVADGMGGHHAGEVASQAIVSALYALVPAGSLAERVDAVEDALVGVNQDLRRHAERCGSATTIGSTVVTMLCAGATGGRGLKMVVLSMGRCTTWADACAGAVASGSFSKSTR